VAIILLNIKKYNRPLFFDALMLCSASEHQKKKDASFAKQKNTERCGQKMHQKNTKKRAKSL
jgi:hypothetical protein